MPTQNSSAKVKNDTIDMLAHLSGRPDLSVLHWHDRVSGKEAVLRYTSWSRNGPG